MQPNKRLDELAEKVETLTVYGQSSPSLAGLFGQDPSECRVRMKVAWLIRVARAAEEFIEAHDVGHEEEHMCLALRKILEEGK